ncbi:MAG: hypothetical protein AVDCRST_MAG88-2401 [uncultured Thermomicrobiales bacterium]|uniref:Uncharacterized protein n=1 Tax=uncultured Thermomicrobiales bacterium TaxID=1645740 RepID=A0A6J4VAB7_9BACT|nr:MAG: hypothetical protein AVDCRST_MAG88-2401 [uncultured Thermomicrobiales bacterium]
MEPLQQHEQRNGRRQAVVIPSRVLVALDVLKPEEQAAMRAAFQALETYEPDDDSALDIKRAPGEEPLYVLRLTPQLWALLLIAPGAPIEVADIVRPETLRRTFSTR